MAGERPDGTARRAGTRSTRRRRPHAATAAAGRGRGFGRVRAGWLVLGVVLVVAVLAVGAALLARDRFSRGRQAVAASSAGARGVDRAPSTQALTPPVAAA